MMNEKQKIKFLLKEYFKLILEKRKEGMPKLPGRGRPSKKLINAIDVLNRATMNVDGDNANNNNNPQQQQQAPTPALNPSPKKFKFDQAIDPEYKTGEFDFDEFRKLKTPSERLHYARQKADKNKLGTGSSRIVFDLPGENKVLKVALNNKGIAQNKEEIEITFEVETKYRDYPIVTKIFGHDDINSPTWLISEKVESFIDYDYDSDHFFDLTETSFQDIWGYLNYFKSNGQRGIEPDPEVPFQNALKAIVDFNFDSGDLERMEHWGKTEDGRVVILDYGLTRDVAQKHYGYGNSDKLRTVRF